MPVAGPLVADSIPMNIILVPTSVSTLISCPLSLPAPIHPATRPGTLLLVGWSHAW